MFQDRKNVQIVLSGEVPPREEKISRQRSGFIPSERTIKDDMIGILSKIHARAGESIVLFL